MSELEKFRIFSGDELRDKLDYQAYAAEFVADLYSEVPAELAEQEPARLLRAALQLYFRKFPYGVRGLAMLLAVIAASELHPSRRGDRDRAFRRDVDALTCFFDDALTVAEQTRKSVDSSVFLL